MVTATTSMDPLPTTDFRTETARRLGRLDRLANLLDSSIKIPGIPRRIGLDPLIGLLPVVGDWGPALVSGWFVVEGHRLGARRRTLTRMTGNILLEATVGMIPLLGDAFDAWFRANRRNVRMLREDLVAQSIPGAAVALEADSPSPAR